MHLWYRCTSTSAFVISHCHSWRSQVHESELTLLRHSVLLLGYWIFTLIWKEIVQCCVWNEWKSFDTGSCKYGGSRKPPNPLVATNVLPFKGKLSLGAFSRCHQALTNPMIAYVYKRDAFFIITDNVGQHPFLWLLSKARRTLRYWSKYTEKPVQSRYNKSELLF